MNTVDWVAFVLVIIGALNWGLVGFFQWDLVAAIFGGMTGLIARIIYALVGLAALWMIGSATMMKKE
ncbi:MAG TPA: DUF378 domain-containing protein [Patescibacteria group bacterium]|nr:DUF378 domain-containing protein [Patescibacteria group bacterium]